MSTTFEASAPRQRATNTQTPAFRVRLNSMSASASAKKHAPFSPTKLTASNSGVSAKPAPSASACSAPSTARSKGANASLSHPAAKVIGVSIGILSFQGSRRPCGQPPSAMKRCAEAAGKRRFVTVLA
ncbi:hypothetical protein [Eggerthella sinensis]|uniref:hypothetical protein n=1 Tax=Eggerthella sinensis TaxID=242230 RepID=UPI00248ED664|nr:hypothetical protein [Eggerthella sinensis]